MAAVGSAFRKHLAERLAGGGHAFVLGDHLGMSDLDLVQRRDRTLKSLDPLVREI